MNCTHCKKELKDYNQSAIIPHSGNMKYVSCKECGNVMIGNFNDDNLIEVTPTPELDNMETMAMIEEAKKLFNTAGIGVGRHVLTMDKPGPTELVSEPESIPMEHEKTLNTDMQNKVSEPEHVTFMERVKQFFKNRFKK